MASVQENVKDGKVVNWSIMYTILTAIKIRCQYGKY